MGFSFNAPSVLKQIAMAISDYRAYKNATATQADVMPTAWAVWLR